MKKEVAESFEIIAIYHCPLWLCNHVERTKKEIIEHLVNDHTDEDALNERKEDEIWNEKPLP